MQKEGIKPWPPHNVYSKYQLLCSHATRWCWRNTIHADRLQLFKAHFIAYSHLLLFPMALRLFRQTYPTYTVGHFFHLKILKERCPLFTFCLWKEFNHDKKKRIKKVKCLDWNYGQTVFFSVFPANVRICSLITSRSRNHPSGFIYLIEGKAKTCMHPSNALLHFIV